MRPTNWSRALLNQPKTIYLMAIRRFLSSRHILRQNKIHISNQWKDSQFLIAQHTELMPPKYNKSQAQAYKSIAVPLMWIHTTMTRIITSYNQKQQNNHQKGRNGSEAYSVTSLPTLFETLLMVMVWVSSHIVCPPSYISFLLNSPITASQISMTELCNPPELQVKCE